MLSRTSPVFETMRVSLVLMRCVASKFVVHQSRADIFRKSGYSCGFAGTLEFLSRARIIRFIL